MRDLRRNAKPIALLSIPLVLVTMGAVAVVAHEVVGLAWGPAFVLGAIVSPTDAVAPAEIMRRIGAPRRLITIVEGENLTNDWTALVLYRVRGRRGGDRLVLARRGGPEVPRSPAWAAWRSASSPGGSSARSAPGIDDPPTEITISILSGYAAYLPAEELGLSGVIAAVTVGLYMGWHTPQLTTPVMRLQGMAVWEILTFLLNAVLFLLVGLQLPERDRPPVRAHRRRAGRWALLVSAVVVGVRLLWMFLVPVPWSMATDAARARRRRGAPRPPSGSWSAGPGCADRCRSPPRSRSRSPSTPAAPSRTASLIVFLTFAVILVTLVGQGLTLGPLISWLRLHDDGVEQHEEQVARRRVAEAALERIDELGEPDWIGTDSIERARGTCSTTGAAASARWSTATAMATRSARTPGGG